MTSIDAWKQPPYIKPGDTIVGISPSGAIKDLAAVEKAREIVRSQGYNLELDKHWNAHYGYLGGTDEQRREALLEALINPNYKGIIAGRGGYGVARLLEEKDWETILRKYPKWMIGFSDITSLLWKLARVKIHSIHGPVLTTLAKEPKWSLKRLFNYLEGHPLPPLQGQGWGNGQAQGWLLPANLTVATHLLGTPLQPPLDGVILALEDVGEPPYRIDRMLTQWRLMGAFDGVKGIALGRFSRSNGSSDSWTVEEVLGDRLGDLGIPIVSELPFGHDGVNAILPVGMKVMLDGDEGILTRV
ncbi:putative peptidase S66, LD-carboxypeptidase A [Crocosphaera subtropica ATCC 51142]|uniref:Peptidase S66, LD-carboxypeptidase A n=1 Tax=Crocosphaera subtropica (strain ATCC 51142 / BH68) TaxID=43989 RepID=B1WPK7_CROS5|nr:LD-carboxypeptidase [Crocosphaera subtropica]ACB51577.1 putative peptidase S66, LD-carboxypeptidase A [Crocosphaera subtropica ATCC 51142]